MDSTRGEAVDGDRPAVVGDLCSRDRRGPDPALVDGAAAREYSYRDFVTTAARACNVLRYLGTRTGSLVAIEPETTPKPLFTFFGAALLGGVVSFAPQTVPGREEAPAATVVPVDREVEFDLPPGSKLAVYGGEPTDPRTTHWEAEAWSENPGVPPYDVAPDDPLLVTYEQRVGREPEQLTHGDVLEAAIGAADAMELSFGDHVAVSDSLSDPRVLAAGVLAPLSVGATVVLPGDSGALPDDVTHAVVAAETERTFDERVATFDAGQVTLPDN